MDTKRAHTAVNGRIRRGLRSEPSLERGGEGGGGYGLAMNVEEKEFLPLSSSRICAG